jgi:hypothetical protein
MKKLLFIGLFSCLMFSIGCADKPKIAPSSIEEGNEVSMTRKLLRTS